MQKKIVKRFAFVLKPDIKQLLYRTGRMRGNLLDRLVYLGTGLSIV